MFQDGDLDGIEFLVKLSLNGKNNWKIKKSEQKWVIWVFFYQKMKNIFLILSWEKSRLIIKNEFFLITTVIFF